MAVNHISIDPTKRLGQHLRRCVDLGQDFRDQLRELKAVMDQCIDGEDYSYLESQFGLGTGKGYSAWYQLGNLLSNLETNSEVTGTKDKLDQFLTFLG